MDLSSFFEALDRKPFQRFTLELSSGTPIRVVHPENVFVIPNRSKVHHVEVYDPETDRISLFYPGGLLALHRDRGDGNGDSR